MQLTYHYHYHYAGIAARGRISIVDLDLCKIYFYSMHVNVSCDYACLLLLSYLESNDSTPTRPYLPVCRTPTPTGASLALSVWELRCSSSLDARHDFRYSAVVSASDRACTHSPNADPRALEHGRQGRWWCNDLRAVHDGGSRR